MANSIKCPQCRAPIRPSDDAHEGAVIACPACKSTLKLVADGRGRTETIPVHGGRSAGGSLPPRAAAPEDPAPGRKASKTKGSVPAAQQSRTAVAVFLLIGLVGLALLFVTWYVRTVQSLTKSVDRASARRLARVDSPGKVTKVTKATNGTKPIPQTTPIPRQVIIERPMAPGAMQIDKLVVGVATAEIAPVQIHGNESPTRYLVLSLRITNLGDKPVNYGGWQRSSEKVLLKSVDRNYYNRIRFFPGEFPDGCVETVAIQPTETIKDVLVFEAPATVDRSLELDLPLTEESVFRFIIPALMVRSPVSQEPFVAQRQVSPPQPLQPQQPAPPAGAAAATKSAMVPGTAAPKRSPVEDFTVRRSILAEYRELWAQVERRSKGMSYDRGRQFKRSRRTEILDSLSTKYKVTVEELLGILP